MGLKQYLSIIYKRFGIIILFSIIERAEEQLVKFASDTHSAKDYVNWYLKAYKIVIKFTIIQPT